ncbi:3'-5' exonuclease [uncultured Amphritea sp.]|uniref:3'-5' exonuclease n=1 Tax=uncultured Amphritea sp. TaxID=981605 RepID=UPI002603103D|nr:3'-5' exonuclease [uncultured Amphritea sp.]
MKPILFFDTETTGLPNWKEPSDSECQPHAVQIGAVLADEDTREIIEVLDVIIKPDGWTIPEEVSDIHGITTEIALEKGIPEADALQKFMSLYSKANLRVAHNTTFDNRIIRIGLKRFLPDLVSDEEWKDRERYYCTLMNARKQMGGKSGHTLTECYAHYTGKELQDAHAALADAKACMEVYWAILDSQKAA